MSERDRAPAAPRWRDPRAEPPAVRRALIVAAVAFLALFLLLPLLVVFVRALEKGTAAYLAAIETGDGAAWRLEDVAARTGHGLLQTGTGRTLDDARAEAVAAVRDRYPALT
ncbi:MAG TPA: sulfate/thiosulfate ABC transporter permease CysW, partial [Thermoanaerobaculia bacterium]|nr:sulfate/thiosulfate ABC transporter permease CysW [Thermoanaerobaculia bacterium]